MHSIFRINDIKPMHGKSRIFVVNLTLTSDQDKDLQMLTDQIRKESFPDAEGWYRLGSVLFKIGQFERAEQIYEILLKQKATENGKECIYSELRMMEVEQGEYEETIYFYENLIRMKENFPSLPQASLANSYNNIGSVYSKMGEKALAIEQSVPLNHPDLGALYSNIGLVYENMKNYLEAFSFYEKAVQNGEQSLPTYHPTLQNRRKTLDEVRKKNL